MNKINIMVADDHQLFRTGLVELLKKNDDFSVIASVGNGEELLLAISDNTPDIVLLDLDMPRLNGFETLEKINDLDLGIKVIIISMHDSGGHIANCAKKGAYAYLLKNTEESDLVFTINHVYNGHKYFSADVTERMLEDLTKPDHTSILSKKENEILLLLAKGMTTKEIAEKLFVSTRTVETHRANILKKMKVKNTAELISKGSKLGMF